MVEHTRTLGFTVAFAMGLGTMIAAGIFSLSGTAVAAIGSSAVVAFVIAALVASITAASYSEFASIYSENGGGYLFSSRTFEDRDTLVYAIGISLFLGYTGTTAFYLATMDEWFFEFILPESVHWLPHGTVGIVAAVLLGGLNARGTEESGTFQVIVTTAKVGVLVAFVAGALSYAGPAGSIETFSTSFSSDAAGIVRIAALAFITFFGFSAIAASAGEIIEPRKTVPKAIAASIVTVTILYTFVIVAMVNAPVSQSVLEAGETAMGTVAASFLGPIGQSLIVAGAVFSMVSASNASVLAASGIGSLMGRQGQAPRAFSYIHRRYGTPFWSVTTVTATIVAMIVVFIQVFPATGSALAGVNLGLEPLTGFATLNLLLPLSAVNIALIYSRRRRPDLERPLRVPLVPLIPVVGVLANLALITNLPLDGVVVGVVLIVVLVAAYLVWGGQPHVEDLFEPAVSIRGPTVEDGTFEKPAGRTRILVPVARLDRARAHLRLADLIAQTYGDAHVEVLNVTHVPDQTPGEVAVEEASARVDRLTEILSRQAVDSEYTVEGHICRDVAFDIRQTARDDDVDLIVMGYPEQNPEITEAVAYNAPCDVVFANDFAATDDVSVITVGAGGGPHHTAALPLVDRFGQGGTEIHIVGVTPTGRAGTVEEPTETFGFLSGDVTATMHTVTADSVAAGLVETAAENGGVLLIGASRDRRLSQWLLGSTPDRVVALAEDADVPVLVYTSSVGVSGRIEDRLFPVYRYLRGLFTGSRRWIPVGTETDDPGAG